MKCCSHLALYILPKWYIESFQVYSKYITLWLKAVDTLVKRLKDIKLPDCLLIRWFLYQIVMPN